MKLRKQISDDIDIKIINEIYNMVEPEEELTLSSGFNSCIIGVTAGHPRRIIYDYYKCVEVVMTEEKEFTIDEACDWVETHVKIDVGIHTPIFIKPVNEYIKE